MTNAEYYAKLEEISGLAIELRYVISAIQATDDRWPRFQELLLEMEDYYDSALL